MHAIRDERSYVLNPISDVLSGIDWLVKNGIADPDRLGVLGFSYGGTLTSYLVTSTDRFRAAIYGEGAPNVLHYLITYGRKEFLGLGRDLWGGAEILSSLPRSVVQSSNLRCSALIG